MKRFFFIIFVCLLCLPARADEVVISQWGGLSLLNPAHLRDMQFFQQCDNYMLDSKNEESPRYSSLSVRPEFNQQLNALPSALRGLFHFNPPAGDDAILAIDTTTIYRAGATIWTTLEAGLSDNPWEGALYSDPSISRMYLCNGKDLNRKYLPGSSTLLKMQNQDNETQITGTVYFVYGSSSCTMDASALASVEAGQHIKPATTSAITEWMEIASKESGGVSLSTAFTGSTQTSTTVVRSNNCTNSRFVLDYNGYMVKAYENTVNTLGDTNTLVATMELQLVGAIGAAQKFTATKANFDRVSLYLRRGSGTAGNYVVKVKSSLASSIYLAKVIKPIAELPYNDFSALIPVNFGGQKAMTIGSAYYLTVERENDSASPIYIKTMGNTYANGEVYWTYHGFDNDWDNGNITKEAIYTIDGAYDTFLSLSTPAQNFNNNEVNYIYNRTSRQRSAVLQYNVQQYAALNKNPYNLTSAKLNLFFKADGAGTVTVEAYRIIRPTSGTTVTWNTADTAWATAGCFGLNTDYTATAGITGQELFAATAGGWITLEVAATYKEVADFGEFEGLVVRPTSSEAMPSAISNAYFYASDDADAAKKPRLRYTTRAGSTEAGLDFYFKFESVAADASSVHYSVRNYPENFPDLNTFKVPGQITGLAKSGGYLIVGAKKPEALHFYKDTGDSRDGYGIDFVDSLKNVTFGSSKSIAYDESESGFYFWGGLKGYYQSGTNTKSITDPIRDEARAFSNYQDNENYYGGSGDIMPQGVVWPIKDLYLLSVPKDQVANSYLYNFNYAQNSWLRWTGEKPTAIMVRKSSGLEPELWIGTSSGKIKKLAGTGSTKEPAIMSWILTDKNLFNDKILRKVDLWGVADNPLQGSLITLEAQNTNTVSSVYQTSNKKIPYQAGDNGTTNKQVKVIYEPNYRAPDLKLTLTQTSTVGAISWRSMRQIYDVERTK